MSDWFYDHLPFVIVSLCILLVVAIIGMAFGSEGSTCPEGETFELGIPVYVTIGNVMVPTYPSARCE